MRHCGNRESDASGRSNPAGSSRCATSMAHRGPDDAGYAFFRIGEGRTGEGGYWCGFADAKFRHVNEHLPVFDGAYCRDELSKSSFSVALGHRRLAIIDLTHFGHQPMSSSDRRYWITFNGEIYNFPELREQLQAAGHVFRTRSDTEVILHLWEEHGAGLPADARRHVRLCRSTTAWTTCLTLARDRFGVKPLYYAVAGDFLVFASEIKGILASGPVAAADQPAGAGRVLRLSKHAFAADAVQGRFALAAGRISASCRRASAAPPAPRRYHAGFPAPRPVAGRPRRGDRRRWPTRFRRAVAAATGQRRRSRLAIFPAAWTAARSSPWPAARFRGC